jgi:Na+/H+-dicarboxylate symporter
MLTPGNAWEGGLVFAVAGLIMSLVIWLFSRVRPSEVKEPSAAARQLAALILIVPIIGILVHAAFYVYGLSNREWLHDYVYGPWLRYLVAPLSFATLVANWLHYRQTRMNLDIASRIVVYLWITSYVLLFIYTRKALTGP